VLVARHGAGRGPVPSDVGPPPPTKRFPQLTTGLWRAVGELAIGMKRHEAADLVPRRRRALRIGAREPLADSFSKAAVGRSPLVSVRPRRPSADSVALRSLGCSAAMAAVRSPRRCPAVLATTTESRRSARSWWRHVFGLSFGDERG
jgi:hypothetical protein